MTTKAIKDYLNKGIRRLKHGGGFGVHSPFAYDIIREVIEEKCPYYAYQTMQRMYPKNSSMSFKEACLLLRLANRFRVREVLEMKCDGGRTALPIVLTDSRNRVTSVIDVAVDKAASDRLVDASQIFLRCSKRGSQVAFVQSLSLLPENYIADMMVISDLPKDADVENIYGWMKAHCHESSIFWLKGIRRGGRIAKLWERFCDDDKVEITMDMYDYGLAIRRPHFYKQHYVVSF